MQKASSKYNSHHLQELDPYQSSKQNNKGTNSNYSTNTSSHPLAYQTLSSLNKQQIKERMSGLRRVERGLGC
jgi:hypothetical protein